MPTEDDSMEDEAAAYDLSSAPLLDCDIVCVDSTKQWLLLCLTKVPRAHPEQQMCPIQVYKGCMTWANFLSCLFCIMAVETTLANSLA